MLGLERLLDVVPVLVWTAQDDGSIDYVNARWTEYTGLPVEQSLGWGWLSVVHPEDVQRARDVWEVSIAKRVVLELQLRFRRRDGTYRWHLARAVPIFVDEQARWIGSSFDIDRQKRVEQSLAFLASANELLSASLDTRSMLERLVARAVPEIADWCAAYVSERGKPVAIAATPAGRFTRWDSDASDVIARGRPFVVRGIADAPPVREIAILPMIAGANVVGAFAIAMAESGRTFAPLDLQFAAVLSNRAATAVANAALFERERRAADLLQRALLPAALPEVAGVRLDACYVSAESMRNVGGDWYDAFVLDDRRTLLSIGDVSGKGLAAAATMARVRDSLRAAALCGEDVVRILEVADDALRGEEELFVTCFAGIYDSGDRSLQYACAGHHAPRVREPGGHVFELPVSGLPLGLQWAGARPRASGHVELARGALLVLFTDGLVEQRRDAVGDSKRLDAAIAALSRAGTAGSLCNAFVAPPSSDDVAILTLEIL